MSPNYHLNGTQPQLNPNQPENKNAGNFQRWNFGFE
jgi:hypothetical protein